MTESYREMMARIMEPGRSFKDRSALAVGSRSAVAAAIVSPEDEYFGVDKLGVREERYARYLTNSSVVYTCIRKRAVTAKSVCLKFYRTKKTGKDEFTGGRVNELFTKVNPFWTWGRLLEATEQDMCTWGEAFWVLERDGNLFKPPIEIWRARPDRMHVVPTEDGYIKGFIYVPEKFKQPIAFDRRQVVWMRYPHPTEEFIGLSPLSSARLTVDTTQAALRSNQSIFFNGMQLAGIIRPKGDKVTISKTQAEEIIADLDLRFSGLDKRHRWAVFRFDAEFTPLSVTPKDAEFLGLIEWGLNDIANVFGVPQDLVGGQRTYENVQAAMKAFWVFTMKPELQMFAEEITEQILPYFQGEADLAEFDFSEIEVLQEDKEKIWRIEKEQMTAGVLTQNDWRKDKGLDPVGWGDVWWAPVSLVPVAGEEDVTVQLPSEKPDPIEMAKQMKELEAGDPQGEEARWFRALDFGSSEHHRLMLMFARRTAPHVTRFDALLVDLFRRQRDSVLARLNEDESQKVLASRSIEGASLDPFDRAVWQKRFLQEARSVIRACIEGLAAEALTDIGLDDSFNMDDPHARNFLETRAQRFATRVNDTTYSLLQQSLSEGIGAHETIDQLADRVRKIMGDKARAEMIARTEVIGAANGGTLEAWRQSSVVETKRWLAALDDRTRASHVQAHGQEVPLESNFIVGGHEGPFLVASGWAQRTSTAGAP